MFKNLHLVFCKSRSNDVTAETCTLTKIFNNMRRCKLIRQTFCIHRRLLDAVAVLTTSRVTDITDAMLLLAAMECIRCVMNNTQGLEFFITDIDATHQLIKGKTTSQIHTMIRASIVITFYYFLCQLLFKVALEAS